MFIRSFAGKIWSFQHQLCGMCSDLFDYLGQIELLIDLEAPFIFPECIERRPVFAFNKERKAFVAWCAEIVAMFGFPEAVTSLAVNYMDRCIMAKSSTHDNLLALCGSCFILACKFSIDTTFSYFEVMKYIKVLPEEMFKMERSVLDTLSWRLHIVTPNEVIEKLTKYSLGEGFLSQNVIDHLKEVQSFFTLESLLESRLVGLRPTSIGFACYILSVNHADISRNAGAAEKETQFIYTLAFRGGVDLKQLRFCINVLQQQLTDVMKQLAT